MDHGKVVCSCGTVISQCRCVMPHFAGARWVQRGCEKCKAAEKSTQLLSSLLTHTTVITPEVEAAVSDAFEYHPSNDEQVEHGKKVRIALELAVLTIIKHVPPGQDRTVAIRKICEARMDANSAITHQGRY